MFLSGGSGLVVPARLAVMAVLGLFVANCSSANKLAGRFDPKYGVEASPRVVDVGQPVPKGGGAYRVGKPYVVAGRTYTPEENRNYREEGLASWYGDDFHGRLTANGEIFDMAAITAAHPTLPMPSYVRVTNLANRRSLIVRVNDRGPYHGNRVIDLSHKAADLLGFRSNGVARVRVEYVGPASLDGSDDRILAATLRQGQDAPAPYMVASASGGIGRGSAQVRHGEPVPVPNERPFRLGEVQAEPVAPLARRGAVDVLAAERSPAMEKLIASAPRSRPEVPGAQVTAYAPARYDAPAAFVSGRGLY
jgi:rare lipoprotein A